MQAIKALEIGKIYQLNNAVVKISQLSYDEVGWIEPKARGKLTLHIVPRWFFEKHATLPQS